ncbi:MAG: hypothetical protein IPO81_28710 [Kouleothrix sp.]|nr:hypothetical protein [Kouleothrix sp.]
MIPLAQRRACGREQERVGPAISTRQALRDCLFLGLVVLLSLALYVGGLGFYSDDWGFLMLLATARDQSLSGLAQALYAGDVVIRQRPLQVIYLAGLYRLFGLQPLGYHLSNGAVLAGCAMLLYLAMRELRQPRLLALAVPLVYALLPHYSTDRFWVAAFQATLSVALYLLSLYADLRALPARPARLWGWRLLGVASLLGSGLAYEVTLPLLLLLNPALLCYRARQLARSAQALAISRARWAALLVGNLVALGLVVWYKVLVTVRVNVAIDYASHVAGLVAGALRVNYGTYGVGLPYIAWWILRNAPSWPTIALAAATGLAIFLYLARVAGRNDAELPGRRIWLALGALGLAVFGLGYAIFLVNADVWFTSTSLGNRIGIAAALGVAISFVAALGWAGALLPAPFRWRALCLLVAALCASGFLITNTLGSFWGVAALRQQAIVRDIRQRLPTLAPGSAVIVDGACLEHGGAYLFTGGRDVAALLAIAYGDPSLQGTAVIEPARVTADGLAISTFRRERSYPYGENLLIYNAAWKQVERLTDAAAARGYFQRSGFDPARDCPPGFAWGWNAAPGGARDSS